LGVFGATPKSNRVIPCKVYDSLAAGLPVITADTRAIRTLLKDRETALLVPPGDAAALAEAILLLAKDPALRERLGSAGLRLFRERASPERLGRQLYDVCVSSN